MQVVQAQAVFVKPLKNPPQDGPGQGAAQGVQEDERPQLRFQAPEEGVEKIDGDAIGVVVMDQVDHQDQGVGQGGRQAPHPDPGRSRDRPGCGPWGQRPGEPWVGPLGESWPGGASGAVMTAGYLTYYFT